MNKQQLKDRLTTLKLQAARHGNNVPPHIVLEIDDITKKLADTQPDQQAVRHWLVIIHLDLGNGDTAVSAIVQTGDDYNVTAAMDLSIEKTIRESKKYPKETLLLGVYELASPNKVA